MQEKLLSDAYTAAMEKVLRNSKSIGVSFPQVAVGDPPRYNNERVSYWTSGFWGGLLWLAYRETRDPGLFEIACEIEERLDEALDEFINMHHDVGFMWLPTAVQHYRMTGCEKSRIRSLRAASILASRFNLQGRFIRSWNNTLEDDRSGVVIVDSMMNIPLLFWAGKVEKDPRYGQIACAHADTVMENIVRKNGTAAHRVQFDAVTGACLGAGLSQGKGPDSAWARGQAWAIYGFAAAHRESGHEEYLQTAERIALRFYSHLPEDKVPYWDFDASEEEKDARDSSAACIAASGMLEIAAVTKEKETAKQFRDMADDLLVHLINKYVCWDDSSQGIVQMGTVNYTKQVHVNVPIIYGDFYFIEALGKRKGLPGFF